MQCAEKPNIAGGTILCSHSLVYSLPLREALSGIESTRHKATCSAAL